MHAFYSLAKQGDRHYGYTLTLPHFPLFPALVSNIRSRFADKNNSKHLKKRTETHTLIQQRADYHLGEYRARGWHCWGSDIALAWPDITRHLLIPDLRLSIGTVWLLMAIRPELWVVEYFWSVARIGVVEHDDGLHLIGGKVKVSSRGKDQRFHRKSYLWQF